MMVNALEESIPMIIAVSADFVDFFVMSVGVAGRFDIIGGAMQKQRLFSQQEFESLGKGHYSARVSLQRRFCLPTAVKSAAASKGSRTTRSTTKTLIQVRRRS